MIPDEYTEALKRSRKERLVDYAIGGTMVMILFAVAMLIVPMIPVALYPPPVDIGPVNVITPMPVCPGDIVEFTASVVNKNPEVIVISSVIYDDKTKLFVPGTAIDRPALPKPYPKNEVVNFETSVGFTVPDIPPGNYTRVSSFVSHNSDTVPVFMYVPFEVGENCEKK